MHPGRGNISLLEPPSDPSERLALGLAATSEIAQLLSCQGAKLRPCICRLAKMQLCAGGFPNRNESAVILASEMQRVGIKFELALSFAKCWNSRHFPPLAISALTNAVRMGYEHKYAYSRSNVVLKSLCIGEEKCQCINPLRKQRQWYNDLCFVDYGWPHVLSHNQTILFSVALPYLERTFRVGLGKPLYANHRQIEKASGISRRRLRKDLETLKLAGLIEYSAGIPRKWERTGTEIRRIFPIVPISSEFLKAVGKRGKRVSI